MKIEKLYPESKDYVWGGNKLKEEYGKQTEKTPCAESWELSFHKDGFTRLANGKTLAETVTERELGENVKGFPFFPTLIKFIDAKQDLSVQVHPSDDYALKNENSFGKTEMWYIVEAEKGAGIYLGFNRDVTKEEYETAIQEKRLTELLNFYEVQAGECYFIPSGTIHAIGKGCLICEIQQNSNLTYRVYDYGRKDKNGNERELHVEKALKVTSLKRHENRVLTGETLGTNKYFTVRKLGVKNEILYADNKTFQCLTCVKGKGEIDGQTVKKGDSFFVPASYGEYNLKGDMEIIVTEIRKYYIGIDLGGTFIKGGIVDDTGRIVLQEKVPTEKENGADRVALNIANLCKTLLENVNMTASDIVGIGMGVPGMINGKTGEVVYSNNLGWEHFRIKDEIESLTGLPVKIANDANVAALGETKFGCGKAYENTVMLTLGTGVGSGIVIDGKLFEGTDSAGAEIGHTVIVAGGEKCTCGRKGCLEAYTSATALIRDTKRAMQADKVSKMWAIGGVENVTGKTAFDYKDCDNSAKTVVDGYIEKLGVGITNIANEFRPKAVILGGGVCAQGDNLIKPLQEYLDREIFAGKKGPQVKILTATLGNSAGLLGAAALWL
ncbi:MAG: ROK family protein [Clostridia bacterium]|nr:ROK family protein [Clostridia bacterium]